MTPKKPSKPTTSKDPVIMTLATRVLLRPRMTEKAHRALALGKYVFQVAPEATKASVKRAIEGLYGVRVDAVNIVRIAGKLRLSGRYPGRRSDVKKAIVTLGKGESIEIFKGL